jgi:malonyl CoA-acyl carrier protein transacylase
MIAFVFPGQGSQQRGMGGSLFDSVAEYVAVEREVDALLGYSLRALCLSDTSAARLKETQYTQPALYVVNALHYYDALRKGRQPSYVAGHSVGEYNALLAAGVFDFLTGLRLVRRRGELMGRARDGGMVAVIGLGGSRIAQLLRDRGFTSIDVANFNSPSQTVISGPVADLGRAGTELQKAGARMVMPLPVSAAFHSRYVAEAANAFEDYLYNFEFQAPSLPVIANVTGTPYPDSDPTATVRSLLVKQMTHSVQWTQSVRYLLARGVSEFAEAGPGNVLTRLIQQIRNEQDG